MVDLLGLIMYDILMFNQGLQLYYIVTMKLQPQKISHPTHTPFVSIKMFTQNLNFLNGLIYTNIRLNPPNPAQFRSNQSAPIRQIRPNPAQSAPIRLNPSQSGRSGRSCFQQVPKKIEKEAQRISDQVTDVLHKVGGRSVEKEVERSSRKVVKEVKRFVKKFQNSARKGKALG